jgi:hypothetical protein
MFAFPDSCPNVKFVLSASTHKLHFITFEGVTQRWRTYGTYGFNRSITVAARNYQFSLLCKRPKDGCHPSGIFNYFLIAGFSLWGRVQ